jgi:hypothetical protein
MIEAIKSLFLILSALFPIVDPLGKNVKKAAGRWILCATALGVLVSLTTQSIVMASWWEKTLQHSFLELRSGLLGADISPDDRFVAIYAADSLDLADRPKDEHIYELQIWDRRAQSLVSRKILLREQPLKNLGVVPRFVRYTDGGSKLVIYQEGHLLVFDSTSLDQIQDIDMEMSRWPWMETGARSAVRPSGRIADLEVDFAGRRAAILIPWGVHAGGELRVYDLRTGKVMQRWEYQRGNKDRDGHEGGLTFYSYRPIAISPDGRTVAISLGLVSPDGQTLAALNTGYLAGPIRFVPGDPLALATVSEQSPEKGHKDDPIRIWNAKSGSLIREINTPSEGARYDVDISADGRVVMSYTTHLKYDFSWLGSEYGAKIFDYRVRLWDLKTGDEIATSPNVLPYSAGNTSNRFRLSPTGRFVLMYGEFFRIHEAPTGQSRDTRSRHQIHFFELH